MNGKSIVFDNITVSFPMNTRTPEDCLDYLLLVLLMGKITDVTVGNFYVDGDDLTVGQPAADLYRKENL